MEILGKIIFSIGLAVSSFFGFNEKAIAPVEPTSFGSFSPVQASQFTLSGAGISSSATTIQLNSFTLPDPARTPITMSMFGSIGYAVIEPQTNKIEVITFTGVTQNANGTALLTGVTRGINFVAPYTASASRALSHSGGSYLILSNPAAFYGQQFALVNDDATITGVWRFNSYLPETSIAATSSNQFVNKALLDATSFQGVATSTESAGGIVELGTLAEQASSFDGGVSKPTVLQTKNSTSTCQVVGSYNIVASTTTGKMDKGCFDQTANYDFTGKNNFQNASSTGLSAGYLYVGGTATSSISSTGVLTLATTTAGVLQTSTSGIVYAGSAPRFTYASTSAGASVTNGYATSTANFVVPALNASSTIQFKGNFTCDNSSNGDRDCTVFLKDSTGATLTTITVTSDAASALTYAFDVMVSREAGTSNWANIGSAVNYGPFFNVSTVGGVAVNNTSSLSLSSGATFQVVVRSAGTLTTATLTNYSIIVNP